MQLLYDLLQIPPCSKWNILKRIKTYFRIRNIKKQITNDISNLDSFFKNIVDYCTFMEHVRVDFKISTPENYKCDIIIYDKTIAKYIYILRFTTMCLEKKSDISMIYNTDETDRINVKATIYSGHSEFRCDLYLEKDNLESYKHDVIKNEIIQRTIEYMTSEIIQILDTIVDKYIFRRKGRYNEDEEKEI